MRAEPDGQCWLSPTSHLYTHLSRYVKSGWLGGAVCFTVVPGGRRVFTSSPNLIENEELLGMGVWSNGKLCGEVQ